MESLRPVVLEVGKRSKKRIKQLRRGTGRLAAAVEQAVGECELGSGDEEIIPVILLYEQKSKKKKRKDSGGLATPLDALIPWLR